MFEKIKNAIAKRSDLIRKHEADYTSLLEEKVAVEAARDEAVGRVDAAEAKTAETVSQLDVAVAAELRAFDAKELAEAKVAKYEQQLVELAKQLGVAEEETAVEAEAKPAVAEAVAEEEPAARAAPPKAKPGK